MPAIDKVELGKRLARLPELLGLNSRQIATAIGADPSYYNRAEKGKGLSLNYIDTLIEKFSLSKNWLILGDGQPKKIISSEDSANPHGAEQLITQETGSANDNDPISLLEISDGEKIKLYKEKLLLLQNEVAFWKRIAQAQQKLMAQKKSD